jgi:predicted membrane-bound spermidine synthase
MLYAFSGFTALSLEILWFRVLGVILKSNAYTFGHLLALFLTGLALGSFAGNSRLLRRWPAAASFLALQAAIPLSAALLLDAFALSVNRVPVLDPLWEYLAAYEPLVRLNLKSPLYLIVHGAIPVALILPPTMLMGASFASLQRAVQRDLAELGRRVGWLQTANIMGSMAGALATGLLFLDVLGSAGTLRLLAIVSTLFIVLFARTISGPAMQFVGASLTAVAVLAVAATPTSRTFWARMHGTPAANVTVAEDASGLALLKPRRNNTQIVLHANGIGQSFLPFGGTHTALGTLAAFIHPNPEVIAIIGLGTGDTVFGSAGRAETQRVDSIEIIEPELTVLRSYPDRTRFPALDLVLSDPRIVHHFTDGRAFLRRSSNRYDIIEADALRPTSAYSGNLYSVEYFSLLRDRLRSGGYSVTWIPTPRVLDTFASVFPFVLVLQDVAIGSLTPIAYDRATVEARLASPFSERHFRDGGIDIATVLAPFLRADPIRMDRIHRAQPSLTSITICSPRTSSASRRGRGDTIALTSTHARDAFPCSASSPAGDVKRRFWPAPCSFFTTPTARMPAAATPNPPSSLHGPWSCDTRCRWTTTLRSSRCTQNGRRFSATCKGTIDRRTRRSLRCLAGSPRSCSAGWAPISMRRSDRI